jgi:hypothetical protein
MIPHATDASFKAQIGSTANPAFRERHTRSLLNKIGELEAHCPMQK